MGQHDKQISAAKEIAEGWVEETAKYLKKYKNLERNHDGGKTLADLAADIKKGEHLTGLEDNYRNELDKEEDHLKSLVEMGDKMFSAHYAWALREPRKSMKFIAEELDLGAPRSEPYEAVAKALKAQLIDTTTAIAATEEFWSRLKAKLETDQKHLLLVRQVFEGKIKQADADFNAWYDKANSLLKLCATKYPALKVDVDERENDENKVRGRDRRLNEQKVQQFQVKSKTVGSLTTEIVSQWKGLQQVVVGMTPAEKEKYRSPYERARIAKEDTLKKLEAASALYVSLLENYEKWLKA